MGPEYLGPGSAPVREPTTMLGHHVLHMYSTFRLQRHRRRIKTEEEKAKVVASVWGKEFIQFLAALAILPRTILKNRMKSINHPIV